MLVVAMLLCPSTSWTTLVSTPFSSSRVAYPWRRLWGVAEPIPAAWAAAAKVRLSVPRPTGLVAARVGAVVSEQGKEAVVAILGANDFFGEGCLAGQARRIATVTAMANSAIVRLEKAGIIRLIHTEPAFAEIFIGHLLGRTIRIEADLVDQLFNSSEKRLARLLLLLANFGKEGQPEPVIAKISQETLAEMIGTTRARVSLFMNKFRQLGFIDYNGGIAVHSSLLNVVLHDQPKIDI